MKLQNEPKANVSFIGTPKIIRQSGIDVLKEERKDTSWFEA